MSDRTRTFSIFLLKPTYDQSNCLEKEHKLKIGIEAKSLPEGAALFVSDAPPTEPWWRKYFQVSDALEQTSKGALIVLPVSGRHFALCFGHVQHNLVDGSYVYDFGLKVTLNAVDPTKLKSTDTLEPGSSRRRRTQLPNEAELTLFDFDSDSSILKSLTGKVRADLEGYFKHPTGSSNLRVGTKIGAAGLADLCKRLLSLYDSDAYLKIFPEIRSIEPLRDPAIIGILDKKLESAIQAKADSVILSVPEFVDYTSAVLFSFSGLGAGKIYHDVFSGRYYEYILERGKDVESLTLAELGKHKLLILGEDEEQKKSFSIYKCLVFETGIEGSSAVYHLNDGTWYRVDSSLVEKLKSYLDPVCTPCDLPEFKHSSEGKYNEFVGTQSPNLVCLDRTNISPQGQKQVEPCDLLDLRSGSVKLIHVKISTQSASLSHLFNQGLASIELLRDDPSSLEKMTKLIASVKTDALALEWSSRFEKGQPVVQYGIVTHKKPDDLSDNLPLFSRLSLARAVRLLRRMNIKPEVVFISDKNPPLAGTVKVRGKKGKKDHVVDDDAVVEESTD